MLTPSGRQAAGRKAPLLRDKGGAGNTKRGRGISFSTSKVKIDDAGGGSPHCSLNRRLICGEKSPKSGGGGSHYVLSTFLLAGGREDAQREKKERSPSIPERKKGPQASGLKSLRELEKGKRGKARTSASRNLRARGKEGLSAPEGDVNYGSANHDKKRCYALLEEFRHGA